MRHTSHHRTRSHPAFIPAPDLSLSLPRSAAVVACALSVMMTQASNAAWIGDSSGTGYVNNNGKDYNRTANWASSTIDDSFAGFTLTGDLTVYMDANRTTTAGLNLDYSGTFNLTLESNATVRTITLNGDVSADTVAGGRTIRIGNTGFPVTLALSTNQRTFTVGSTDTLIVQNITGSNGFIKAGTGVLELSTTTNVTSANGGAVVINAGTMRYGAVNALAAPNVVVNNGGTLDVVSFTDTIGALTLNHGGTITGTSGLLTTNASGLTSNGGTVSFTTGGINLGGGTLTYLTDSGNETQLSITGSLRPGGTYDIADGAAAIDVDVNGFVGDVSGNIHITKNGAGTIQYSGTTSNNFSNGTHTINDGTILLNKNDANATVLQALGLATVIGDNTGAANSAVVRHVTGSNNEQLRDSGDVTVNSDGLLDVNNHTETISNLTLNGGNVTIGSGLLSAAAVNLTGGTISSGATGALRSTNNVTVNAAANTATISARYDLNGSNRTFTVNDGAAGIDLDMTGAIIGTGVVVKSGAGLMRMSGNNTYTSATTIGAGTLSVSSLNSVVGGTASSNLGAPTTVANGTITLGANAGTTGTLTYTGTGETTDRVINLGSTGGGGGVLDMSGTGALVFSSNFTSGASSKTLTLTGSTAGTGQISGNIVNNSVTNITSVTKDGTGKWILSGANTYTGSTTITAGTLVVNGSLNAGSAVAVNGGTLAGTGTIGGTVNVASGGALAPGNSIGTLTISNTLTLAGASNFEIDDVLDISDLVTGITTLTYGGTLNVTNLGDDSGYYDGQIFDLFDFTSQSGTFAAVNLPTLPVNYVWKMFGSDLIDYSTGEVVVLLIPEPASLALMLAGALLMTPFRGRGPGRHGNELAAA